MKSQNELEIKLRGKTEWISPGKIYLGTIPVGEYVLFVFNTSMMDDEETKLFDKIKNMMEGRR